MNYFFLSKILAPFLLPGNYIIFLLFFFLYHLRKKNFFIKILILFFIIIGVFPAGDIINYNFFEKNYIANKAPKNIDNIIVLGGSQNLYGSYLSKKVDLNDNSDRMFYGSVLHKDNPGSKLIFLGGNSYIKQIDYSEHEIAKRYFINFGLNIENIIFEKKSKNTIENFQNLIKIKNLELENKKNILVTSAYHLPRSIMIARYYNINLVPFAVDFRSLSIKEFDLSVYYQTFNFAKNISVFDRVFREVVGMVAFSLKTL